MTNIDQKLVQMQKQMESMEQANVDKLESILKEYCLEMESIREECGAQMESVSADIRHWMSTIKTKIIDQTNQLQSEEGSSFVDAAPGVRNGEQDALQLTEDFELAENEEHINPESQYYAYFSGIPGLSRVKIPLSRNQEIKFEPVLLNDPSNPLLHGMALFSHPHNHSIYILGGRTGYNREYSCSLYVFDPNKPWKLPIHDVSLLDRPKNLHHVFKPTTYPSLVQSEDRIYLISSSNSFSSTITPFIFQSFDLTKNRFETLKAPPYQEGQGAVLGFFSLCGYIYLFITNVILGKGHFGYIFNTRSSQWEKHILDRFDELEIPLPSSCIGDVGLSDQYRDKFRILVILNAKGPAAYCIRLCENGSLRPNSYRRLDEIFIHRKYKTQDDYAHLHDLGQGKFCVLYRSYKMPLLIYVFKINFDVEHHIQIHGIKKSNGSSRILYSKILKDPIPMWSTHFIRTLCFASTTSNKGRGRAATSNADKDVEEKGNDIEFVK